MASRVLVTGPTGFIGSKLFQTKTLVEYFPIERFNLLEPNSTEIVLESAKKNGCDAILHLAWNSNRTPNYTQNEENYSWVEASYNIALGALKENITPYLVGSCLDSTPNKNNLYSDSKNVLKSKLKNEIELQTLAWIRPFYVYDFEAGRPRLLSDLRSQCGTKRYIGSGRSRCDYVSVADVVSGVDAILENQLMGITDIGSGFLTANYDLACHFAKAEGGYEIISKNECVTDSPKADIRKLENVGWSPKITKMDCFHD